MSQEQQQDWISLMSNWAYATGSPTITGQLKASPEDFKVNEDLMIMPAGEGEHIWLQITKRRQNTETVAKALARHANVAYQDVGYSGLKDFNALTQQWFSIYQPKGSPIDWQAFEFSGVHIDQISRHTRKIKRGTHKTNNFVIKIRDFNGELSELERRIEIIKKQGVPNYFGEQRFGRNVNNMQQATALLVEGKRFKDRHLQSLLYSAARSWLFNCIISERINGGNWSSLYAGEPANLNATNSVFNAENNNAEAQRLSELDIHPTAPMWGKYRDDTVNKYAQLHEFEQAVLADYLDLCHGLETAGLNYQRRAVRMQVGSFECVQECDGVVLSFNLLKGQYATSVLRELIQVN